ncbi:MAG: RepB family plasmid replication initiator protein [Cetobacterium sp.]
MTKKNQIVQYNNEMNTFNFGKFKEKELDLFFSLCFKAKEQGLEKIEIHFSELKELSNYSSRNLIRFVKDLEATYDKLIGLKIKIGKDNLNFTKFNIFEEYEVNSDNKIITVKVSKKFEHLLNNILKLGNYTKFDLIEFVSLKSSYSKNMFRLLKQWDNTKKTRLFKIEDFRNLLSIPEKYRMSEIDKYVLSPIMSDLPRYFNSLTLEKIKEKNRVVALNFKWKHKVKELPKSELLEIEISSKLNKYIEKAKKNRFLTSFFDEKNIQTLIHTFTENDAIKGLEYCYKTVKQDVPRFSYLLKIMETGINNSKIKIKVLPKEIEEKEKDRVEIVAINEEENFSKLESDSLFLIFLEMDIELQNTIIQKASELFLKEIGAEKMNSMFEKFFEKSKKKFILKAIRENTVSK